MGRLCAGRSAWLPMRRGLLASLLLCLAAAAGAGARSAVGPAMKAGTNGSLPGAWQRGAAVRAWSPEEFATRASDEALRALRDSGTTHAAFVATTYMRDSTSSRLEAGADTPTDQSLLHAIKQARALGMTVVVKPHVDVLDGSFRGDIAPSSVDDWFRSYREFIYHYAELAREAQAKMLVVGTELTSMSRYEPEWREIIGGVRRRFPGRLSFAANQIDGAQQIGFWDALDYIGIDAYMPLAIDDPNPTVDELTAAWRSFRDAGGGIHRYVDEIAALHSRYGRPVLFTELGYRSSYGTAARPWEWKAELGAAAQEPQARAYEAALRVWSENPWFRGIYWWDWHAGWYDPNDSGYNPRGKLAEGVMRAWNG